MKWVKAPEELKVAIERLMQGIECEKKPMFGYPAYFINRNMFAGLFQSFVFLRLSPELVQSLRKEFPALAPLEPMPGRPMKDYFVIPETLRRDEDRFRKVASAAAEYTRTLPQKQNKKPASRKRARGS